MSQLDSGTFQQVKDLVLSGYHLNDIHGLACPTALLPQNTSVESLERYSLERFRFRGAMDTTSIDDFVRYSVGYARKMIKHVALLMPITCWRALSSISARWITQVMLTTSPRLSSRKQHHSARYWRSTAITSTRSKSLSGWKTGATIC